MIQDPVELPRALFPMPEQDSLKIGYVVAAIVVALAIGLRWHVVRRRAANPPDPLDVARGRIAEVAASDPPLDPAAECEIVSQTLFDAIRTRCRGDGWIHHADSVARRLTESARTAFATSRDRVVAYCERVHFEAHDPTDEERAQLFADADAALAALTDDHLEPPP